MANPPKPWKVEYAKSGRSSCKSCKDTIGNEKLRIGKMVQSTHFDGFMPMWYHTSCIMKKANQIKSVDDVEGIESLRWDDQQKLRKYVESGTSSDTVSIRPAEFGIEVSQTSRATCKCCNQKITKGEVRMSTKSFGQGTKGLVWHHAQCFLELAPSTVVENLDGWNSLPYSNREDILSLVPKVPTSSTVIKEEKQEGEDGLEQLATKGCGKRKKDFGDAPNLKACKMEDDPNLKASGVVSNKANSNVQKKEPIDTSDLNNILEIQSKSIWAVKDDLKKNTTLSELREMLDINSQDSTGSEIDLRDRCADGMLFGALGHCPACSGHISYSGGIYRCRGYLTAWSKCSYSTTQPERLKGKWNIPDETTNSYLLKWLKSQKVKKPARVLPPPSSSIPSERKSSSLVALSQQNESIGELKVAFVGIHKESIEEWKLKIEGVGGLVHKKMSKETSCVVMSEDTVGDGESAEVKRAKRMKLPIVREDYLVECFAKCKKLPFELYKIKHVGEEASSVVTIKVKGRSAVHESSGLQDNSHILEEGSSIYNTTLNLSDLSTGVNSYYILQIIQEDKGRDCYVFRKWGRVGNEKIGGSKLEELSQFEAIYEFKRLFLEKTGNTWEAWEGRDDFHKQPGRFFPLDIDYGVNKDAVNERNVNDSETQLSPPLLELMKMLFNKETYRSAMMEFQINMTEMPLGKLSKYNIQKGFEALTEIQNLFSSKSIDHSMKESLIVDASNRFFTVIPSINPHVIANEDDLMAKIKMLDTLQDIEIASRLVGFDADTNDTFDDKYKKLRCDILSLPHDSEDYKMIDMYLQSTHAPTHEDWNLELEEVFTLEREGEIDKYAPCREKLQNKMLLWHGSRLTNFVGILSEGLRIAPPEAPATGYMFGKGIYFADLVSKSAQYCYSSRDNPVGLMLLSEVALGEIHQLKKAKYMEKPPKGKQSTKGVGKMKPRESEQVVWRKDVVVPCGTPIPSDVRAPELMYNEYIVYNTDQVKLQFLLKVRFHHKK